MLEQDEGGITEGEEEKNTTKEENEGDKKGASDRGGWGNDKLDEQQQIEVGGNMLDNAQARQMEDIQNSDPDW